MFLLRFGIRAMKQFLKSVVVTLLTYEARLLLRRCKPKIIAVTGSVGKTTTKDAIYSTLRERVHARKSQKSYNSEIGVPLSILGLENAWNNPFLWLKNIFDGLMVALFSREYPRVLVLEIGVDRPGDMKRLTHWLKPDVVVLTRLPDVPVHVEYFRDPEDVTQEKLELVSQLREDGVLIYNHDDERVRAEAGKIRQRTLGYSRYSPSDFTLTADEVLFENRNPVGMKALLTHQDETVELVTYGALGIPHVYSYAAAVAVATQFDVSLTDAVGALKTTEPPRGRMRLLSGIERSCIIDDTYNSSPAAAEQALVTLRELALYDRRKVVVFGDMLELGKYSSEEHERIGALAATVATVLITVGVRSRKVAEGALEHGLSEKMIHQYETIEDAMAEVPRMITHGDVILVKGSQSMRAEKLVALLLEDRTQAGEVLVRQDSMWERK